MLLWGLWVLWETHFGQGLPSRICGRLGLVRQIGRLGHFGQGLPSFWTPAPLNGFHNLGVLRILGILGVPPETGGYCKIILDTPSQILDTA